jgi:hypothetical protein
VGDWEIASPNTYDNPPGMVLMFGGSAGWSGSSGGYAQVAISSSAWSHVVYTVNIPGSTATAYVNGALQAQSSLPTYYANAIQTFGMMYEGWNGYMTDVQFYNTTLSSTQVASLYAEGIGGVPVSLQNLVGWWPLNNNANDYSGNNNNGATASSTFISTWGSGYGGH